MCKLLQERLGRGSARALAMRAASEVLSGVLGWGPCAEIAGADAVGQLACDAPLRLTVELLDLVRAGRPSGETAGNAAADTT